MRFVPKETQSPCDHDSNRADVIATRIKHTAINEQYYNNPGYNIGNSSNTDQAQRELLEAVLKRKEQLELTAQYPGIPEHIKSQMNSIEHALDHAYIIGNACAQPATAINATMLNQRYELCFHTIADPFFNALWSEAQYEITKIMCDKDGMIAGISAEEAKKINAIMQHFAEQVNVYLNNHKSEIALQVTGQSNSSIRVDPKITEWLDKVRNNPDNKNFFELNKLCREGRFKEALPIVNTYASKANNTKTRTAKTTNAYMMAAYTYQCNFFEQYDAYGIRKEFANHPAHATAIKNIPRFTKEFGYARDDINVYLEHIQSIEQHLYSHQSEKIIDHAIIESRQIALQKYYVEGDARVLTTPLIDERSVQYLEEMGINPQILAMNSNALQRELQDEFKAIIEKTALIYNSPVKTKMTQAFQANAQLIEIGAECIAKNYIVQAQIIADGCYKILGDLERYQTYLNAIGKGAAEGISNTFEYMKEHPWETALTICFPELMAPYHLSKIVLHSIGYTYDRLSKVDYPNLSTEKVSQKFEDLYNKCKAIPCETLLRQGTAIVMQIALDRKITAGINQASRRGLEKVTHEICAMQKPPDTLSKIIHTPNTGHQVPTKKQLLRHNIESTSPIHSEPLKQPNTLGDIVKHTKNTIAQLEQLLASVDAEIHSLSKLFDNSRKGFAEFANKFIKLPYKHILNMEFSIGKRGVTKFSGFHHDLHGLVENSGLVQFVNKKVLPNGFYSADIMWMGKPYRKTFFPKHWSREQVMNKILEAYDNFIKDGTKNFILTSDGKYWIQQSIGDNMFIEMYITKSGHITTAYPVFKIS